MDSITKLNNAIANKKLVEFDPDCVRRRSNMSYSIPAFKFDRSEFNPTLLLDSIPTYSPKLDSLLKNIEELDSKDYKQYGKKFKHFIFSDLKMAPYGAKLIASALIAKGHTLGYTASLDNYTPIHLVSNLHDGFYLLSSVSVYDRPKIGRAHV